MTAPPVLTPPGPLPVIKHLTPNRQHYEPWPGPGARPILGVVLHSTGGSDSRLWLSTDPHSAVSIHVLIQRDGVRLNVCDYNDIAWHVGTARPPWENRMALGCEYENASNDSTRTQAYTPAQLSTGAHWLATVMYSYNIPWERVVRHGDVALPVGRRTDPMGPFPLDVLHVRTQAWLDYWAACSPEERARTII